MNSRLIAVLAVLSLLIAACDSGDTELSPGSTIITGGTNAPATTTTTGGGDTDGTTSPTSLVGETVTDVEVVARFPNDNGEERYYVIPNGAYTDVDLQNFVIVLIENDSELYGAEVFDSEDAANAYLVAEGDRTPEQTELLARHHFVTLVGRDRIEFRGPFAEFSGGAIGS